MAYFKSNVCSLKRDHRKLLYGSFFINQCHMEKLIYRDGISYGMKDHFHFKIDLFCTIRGELSVHLGHLAWINMSASC